jgi:hypothetical protein
MNDIETQESPLKALLARMVAAKQLSLRDAETLARPPGPD